MPGLRDIANEPALSPAAAQAAPRSKSPSRHDLPQAERRRQILSATVSVIALEGLSLTTVEKVARQARVSPGTVTFHFHSKDELLLACLDSLAREFDAARRSAMAVADKGPMAALERLIEATFDPIIATPEKVAVWYAFWGEAPARSLYMARVGAGDRSYLEDLERLLGALAAEHRLKLDPPIAARAFAGLLEWLWQTLLVEGHSFDRRAAIWMAKSHLASLTERSCAGA